MAKKKQLVKKENKLVLTNSPFSNKQLLHLMQRTPAKHIYTRPAKGGGEWDYVTGTYIKKVLNYVFGWMWDFQIVDKGREGALIWVQGRLTIKNKKGEPFISKEQFGRADIKFKKGTKIPLDYGNDLKAAATDALKKTAAELGIASDVYGKNEFKDIEDTKVVSTVEVKEVKQQIDYVAKLREQVSKMTRKEMSNEQVLNFINQKLGSKMVRTPTQEVAQRLLARLLVE